MFIKLKPECLRNPVPDRIGEELSNFLTEWFDDREYVVGHTSGSTGQPKEILLAKEDMRASARLTNTFLGIGEDAVLLLSLSVEYIAGKMMVVRALEAGAELWVGEVSSHPLRNFPEEWGRIDLAAMVPLQVEETLKCPDERRKMNLIRHLLIGGAPVLPVLEKRLMEVTTQCYATYGMTETVSHVALKKLNRDAVFCALGNVCFEADDRGCLVIRAPHLQSREFITNDLVRLIDTKHFEWLGRFDHVINSGGIKFFPEVLEQKIASCISGRFFIIGLPDERLGQHIVLAIEGIAPDDSNTNQLRNRLGEVLTPYEMPKEIVYLPRFQQTSSGKVIRKIN